MSRYVRASNQNPSKITDRLKPHYRRGRPEKPEAEKTQEERVSTKALNIRTKDTCELLK
jgi:hypothetical protein